MTSLDKLKTFFTIEKPTKESVIDLLAKLNDNGTGVQAYVAGGWLRDIDNGIEPKDADIFVCPTTESQIETGIDEALMYTLTSEFKPHLKRTFHPNYHDDEMITFESTFPNTAKAIEDDNKARKKGTMRPDVDYVIKYGSTYDVVVMHTGIEDTITNFDVSICQIYAFLIDGELVVRATKQYTEYKKNNLIFQYPDIQTTDDHITRIREKFPDADWRHEHNPTIRFIDLPYDLWDNASE